MEKYLVRVYITLLPSVSDSQGNAIQDGLHQLGHNKVHNLRMGKYIHFQIDANSREEAVVEVKQMCDTLLANPVIETYRFDIL